MKSDPITALARLAAFSLLMSATVFAADKKKDDTRAKTEIRLLPLGSTPPLVMKSVGGRYEQQPYKPGEAPPDLVWYASGKTYRPLSLGLNRISRIPAVKTEAKIGFFTKNEATEGAHSPWCEAEVPPECVTLLVLAQPGSNGRWNRPRTTAVDISPAALPEAGVRIMNLSGLPLEGYLGQETFRLTAAHEHFIPASKFKTDTIACRFASRGTDGGQHAEIDSSAVVSGDTVRFLILYPSSDVPGRRVDLYTFDVAVADRATPAETTPARKSERVATTGAR